MKKYLIPFFVSTIKAGFPSPADDFLENRLNLNTLLIEHPEATFFVQVSGDSMVNAGIHNGDKLIVDRSLEAKHNDIIVAVIDNEFTVKRLKKVANKIYLYPENPNYQPIFIPAGSDFIVWGVVKHSIRSF